MLVEVIVLIQLFKHNFFKKQKKNSKINKKSLQDNLGGNQKRKTKLQNSKIQIGESVHRSLHSTCTYSTFYLIPYALQDKHIVCLFSSE